MDAHVLHALELPKVLQYLAGFTVSESATEAALALCPIGDEAERQKEERLFDQGWLWHERKKTVLSPFPPLDGVLHEVGKNRAVLDLDAFWALRQVLGQARTLMDDLQEETGVTQWPAWAERCRVVLAPTKSMSGLVRCLSDEGTVRDEASPELALVRGELRGLHQQCIRRVKDFATEYNIAHYLQDDFMTLSSDRYVLPLKANFKGRLQGVIHDYSQTGETCYFEPLFLMEVNNRLQELKREERNEEYKIFQYLTSLVRDELPGIRSAYQLLVEIDVMLAKVRLAGCYQGRLVHVEPGGEVNLIEARHPLLALATSQEAAKALRRVTRFAGNAGEEEGSAPKPLRVPQAVPSSLELRKGEHALVISGGNAGGKTVCLKTLGLIALMSACALPVPVKPGSSLPLWRNIHPFIGDEQSLEDHVSTFTAQITHLARVWPSLGPETLVILDEFGAGTDPSQGAALAQAVLDAILERGGYVVAATHFPALKIYALSTQGVRAASVLFDPKSKKPLFRLAYDQVGSSQALDVAREHGLPEEVLRRAEQYLLLTGEDTSAMVERLNELAVAKEAEIAALDKSRHEYTERRRKLTETFAKEKETLFAQVQAASQQVLADWKAGKAGHRQTLKNLAGIRAELVAPQATEEEAAPSPALDLAALAPGATVRHLPWKRNGTVLEVDVRKNRVRLDFSGVSLWAEAKHLAPQEAGGAAPQGKNSGTAKGSGKAVAPVSGGVPATYAPLHLDLRGMRADVAVNELAKFLDKAIMSGHNEVEVVHGRGTGALRRELHAFLQTFPSVSVFRLAPEDRGGDGMTIVELK